MIDQFDGELGEGGFLIKVSDKNVTLPNGHFIQSGTKFRNEFHLNPIVKADYFVPCGGRPESINMTNIEKMFTEDGKCRFPHIIEGANLFITDPARQVLEDRGVILFKDASTNKGGVTSSSLEVLAGLSFDDKEFTQHMASDDDGRFPEFYKTYVDEIITRVEANAKCEFEIIWKEHQETGRRTIELTLELSEAINDLFDVVLASDLYEKPKLRKAVLMEFFPKTLSDKVGYETLMKRIPETYLRASFAKYLSA